MRGLWGISSPCTHRNKPTTRHLRTWNRVSFPLADSPQEELIAACDLLGEQTLKAHLQALLDQNPFC